MSRRVLVTGATGHLGNNLVRRLYAQGDEVRAGVRDLGRRAILDGVGCEVVHADLLDPASLQRALAGVEILYQVGAVFKHWAPNPERDIYQANLEGTRNIMGAAARAGVARVVYVSSLAAADHSRTPITGSGWNMNQGNLYYRSKVDAERFAWSLSRQHGLPMVAILPGAMIGPNCFNLTPTMKLLEMVFRGRLPADAGFKFNFVDVEDIAVASLLAAAHGRPGERYVLANKHSADIAEIVRIAQQECPEQDIKMPAKPPRAILYVAALLIEAIAKLKGSEPSLRRRYLQDFTAEEICDCSKARSHLGFAPRPASEALTRAFRWLATHGVPAAGADMRSADRRAIGRQSGPAARS
jgi:nucleoside-diphosphate-sugar epimerase